MEKLEIVGHRTVRNELEDFWMSRVETLEKQYDEHINTLQKELFEHKFHSRVFASMSAEKDELSKELKRSSKKCKALSSKIMGLDEKVEQLTKQKERTTEKLEKTKSEADNLLKTVRGQQRAIKKAEMETNRLDYKLSQNEQEKKKLAHEISVKDNELRQLREREAREARERLQQQSAVQSFTEKFQETQAQKKFGLEMDKLIRHGRTQEEKLHEMRKLLEEASTQMQEDTKKAEMAHEHEKFRVQRDLSSAQQDLSQALAKLALQKQQTENWREEVYFRNARLKSDVNRNEISNLRGQVATLKGQLKGLEKERERFMDDRSKLAQKLQGLDSLEKSLAQLVRENVRTRNQIIKRLKAQDIHPISSSKKSAKKDEEQKYGYEKQINRLEKKMKDLEAQLNSTRRRENTLRWTLQHQSAALINQIHWSNKARMKVEARNRESEQLSNAWARRLAQKSYMGHQSAEALDRRAKEKVLQRRLASQTAKLEKLKSEINLNVPQESSLPDEDKLETWKWKHFIQSTTAGSLDSPKSKDSGGVGDSESRKKYIQHLGQNISTLALDIAGLERKQAIMTPLVKQKSDDDDNDNGDDLNLNKSDFGIKGSSLDYFRKSKESTPSPIEEEEEDEESSVITSSAPNSRGSSPHSTKDS